MANLPAPCGFAQIVDRCGCLTGYRIPLLAQDNTPVGFPLNVLNVGAVDLGAAANPSEYVALWNANPANVAVGTLSVGGALNCFVLSHKIGVNPPAKVLGFAGTPPPPQNHIAEIGFTTLDTTGAQHTQAEYLASVDNALPTPTQKQVLASNTLVATPAEFGNTGNKVLFVLVDGTMPVYTKWSILGDALQQNQPIDQSFNPNSGNLVFVMPYGVGYKIYCTYSQTSFGNNFILST